jgi:hypothetical protein
MYLPPYTEDEDTGQIYQDLDAPEAAIKHGGSYCPWCIDLGLKGVLITVGILISVRTAIRLIGNS